MELFGQGLAEWHDWVNTGALAAFAVFVCWIVSRIITHGGRKAFELGERYIGSTEELHDTLKESEKQRSALCERHATGLEAVTSEVAVGNGHLERLVQIHERPGESVTDAIEVIHSSDKDMQRIKKAAIHACEMCRVIAEKEMPNSATEVTKHCGEIERIINNAD